MRNFALCQLVQVESVKCVSWHFITRQIRERSQLSLKFVNKYNDINLSYFLITFFRLAIHHMYGLFVFIQ